MAVAVVGGQAGGGDGVVDIPDQQARVVPVAVKRGREIVGVVGGEGDGGDGACVLDWQGGDHGGGRRGGGDGEGERGGGEVEEKGLAGGQAGCDEMFVRWRRRPRECFQLANLCLQPEHRHPPVLRRIAQRTVQTPADHSPRDPIRTA